MQTFRIFCCAALLLTLGSSLLAQPIYRVVDQHGNVTYTDQKPSDNAEPIALPQLDVLEADDDTIADIVSEDGAEALAQALELVIVAPNHGSTLSTGPGGQVDLQIESNFEIPAAAQLVVFLNDVPQEPIRQLSASFTGMQAGTLRLRVELQTPSGRKLVASDEIQVTLIKPPGARSVP